MCRFEVPRSSTKAGSAVFILGFIFFIICVGVGVMLYFNMGDPDGEQIRQLVCAVAGLISIMFFFFGFLGRGQDNADRSDELKRTTAQHYPGVEIKSFNTHDGEHGLEGTAVVDTGGCTYIVDVVEAKGGLVLIKGTERPEGADDIVIYDTWARTGSAECPSSPFN